MVCSRTSSRALVKIFKLSSKSSLFLTTNYELAHNKELVFSQLSSFFTADLSFINLSRWSSIGSNFSQLSNSPYSKSKVFIINQIKKLVGPQVIGKLRSCRADKLLYQKNLKHISSYYLTTEYEKFYHNMQSLDLIFNFLPPPA